jgi:phenylacetate-CoA ligase
MHYFKEFDHLVRQFQIVQERERHMTLKIVRAGRFSDQLFEEVLDGLRRYVGAEMEIDIEFVDSIPMVHTGKHQATISRLNLDFQKLSQKDAAGR